MKKFLTFLCLLSTVLVMQAQDQKLRVAVFDPTSSGTNIDEGTKVAVRELISSTFVNTGKYTIVERSLLQQVMKEQKFSNTDAVDESQATELGRLAGANKVVLSVVTLVGGRNMLSVKVIDVKTATIDQQRTKIVSSNDLLDIVEPLTLELLGEKQTSTYKNSTVSTEPVQQPKKDKQPTPKSQAVAQSPQNTNYYVSSFKGCGIEIMSRDWFEVKTVLNVYNLPAGWRLPTRDELKCMCRFKNQIENLKTNRFSNYFTSEFNEKKVYIRSFDDCEESKENIKKEKAWIRLVRDFR